MSRTPKTPELPAVSFTPEALQAVIAKATQEAVERATAAMKAELQAALAAKPPSLNNKTEKSLRNEIAVVKAFKKAGYGDVKPHVDVMTYNRFMAAGLRPVPGSKSLKIGNLRLFHKSQCAAVSPEEKAANKDQQQAAVARHEKAAKGKVIPINTANPQ